MGNPTRKMAASRKRAPKKRIPQLHWKRANPVPKQPITKPAAKSDPCPICKDSAEDEAPEYPLSCGHKYHLDCLQGQIRFGTGDAASYDIDTWNRCGICRGVIFNESDSDRKVPKDLREANTQRKAQTKKINEDLWAAANTAADQAPDSPEIEALSNKPNQRTWGQWAWSCLPGTG